MANFNLDANAPHDVASHSVLRADLGSGRSLLVVSGIARPEWGLDTDETQRAECHLRLRVPATHLEQSTAHVGLASISNDETMFAFATDSTRVTVEPPGELVLHTFLALAGEPSTLNRFAYQVVAVDRSLPTEISGTLSWPTTWFRPTSTDSATLSSAFVVEAYERTFGPAPPGLPPTEDSRFIGFGTLIGSVTIGDQTTSVAYRVGALPIDKPLRLTILQSVLQPPDADGARMSPTTPGGEKVQLSVAAPTKAGVDFRATRVGPPA